MRRHSPAAPKAPPKPTDLNLSALEDVLAETGEGVIRRVPPTHTEHLRRCIDAGLLEPAGARGEWRLSSAGVAALAARRVRDGRWFPGSRPLFLNRDLLVAVIANA